jgi:hypothetical protein
MTQHELEDALGKGVHVFLWEFGALFLVVKARGIFLGRNDFRPLRAIGRVELHKKDAPNFREETSQLGLLLQGLKWLASYEDWIALRMPGLYQEQMSSGISASSVTANRICSKVETAGFVR